MVSEFIAVCLIDGTNKFSVNANVLSLLLHRATLGLPALNEESVVFDRSWIPAVLSVMWLSAVDGDEMDETSMSFWFISSSSTDLVGSFGFFFDCL